MESIRETLLSLSLVTIKVKAGSHFQIEVTFCPSGTALLSKKTMLDIYCIRMEQTFQGWHIRQIATDS